MQTQIKEAGTWRILPQEARHLLCSSVTAAQEELCSVPFSLLVGYSNKQVDVCISALSLNPVYIS